MQNFSWKMFVLMTAGLFASVISTKVLADTTYQEESYEDLVRRLDQQRSVVSQQAHTQNDPNILDEITLHGSLGLIASNFNIQEAGNNKTFNMNGFQISAGVDLFTPNIVAEGAIRNFGQQNNGPESYSFRELDLKTFYRKPAHARDLGYRLGAGLATRYLNYSDGNGFNVNETNPGLIGFGALETAFNSRVGLSFELGYRSVLSQNASDQNSVDLTMRVDGFF